MVPFAIYETQVWFAIKTETNEIARVQNKDTTCFQSNREKRYKKQLDTLKQVFFTD